MVRIRFATPDDAAELLEIYKPYVTETAISFEYVVPSVDEFRRRIEATQAKYPYIVAFLDDNNALNNTSDAEPSSCTGKIVGYAYAGEFKSRAAYDLSVEMTVYIDKDCRKSGIGRLLYQEMEQILGRMNVTNLYACIGYPSKDDDEHLTKNSADFHEHMGYRLVGRFHKCGYKFGNWYDMVWMEKMIGDHPDTPEPLININQHSPNPC